MVLIHFISPIGFNNLPLNEQMRLLQGSWGEILSLTLVYRTLESGYTQTGKSASSDYNKETHSSNKVVKMSSSSRNSCQVDKERNILRICQTILSK